DSGVPLRESLAFAAAVVPMLMIERFQSLGLSPESIALGGAILYLAIRFGLGGLLKRYTVHRGMFHSLPAAVIFGELAFLICQCDDVYLRYYKAGAVVAGFLSHLLLDEIWSLKFHRGRVQLKKSFGTAVKVWGDSLWANFSTYAKLALLTYLVLNDPGWMQHYHAGGPPQANVAKESADSEWR
ncbi:MAG: metal-dependent hydrolase, partial [Pirellulales bacterium]